MCGIEIGFVVGDVPRIVPYVCGELADGLADRGSNAKHRTTSRAKRDRKITIQSDDGIPAGSLVSNFPRGPIDIKRIERTVADVHRDRAGVGMVGAGRIGPEQAIEDGAVHRERIVGALMGCRDRYR